MKLQRFIANKAKFVKFSFRESDFSLHSSKTKGHMNAKKKCWHACIATMISWY